MNQKSIQKFTLAAFALILAHNIFLVSKASAEPYLAMRYNQKCSACHTNVTGGGKRTATGNAYALSLSSSPVTSSFSPQLNEAISTGGNFRADATYTRFPDAELQEGDTNPALEVEDTSAFNISNGQLYLEYAFNSNLSFYIDQQVAPEGGRTREAIGIFKNVLGDSTYVKAGRFYLPFGWRLQDDDAFIRQVTGFNFDNADTGVEVGWEPGNWSMSLAVSNGTQGATENNKDKQVSFVGSYLHPNFRIGTSFSHNEAPNDIINTAYNVFGGLNFGKLAVLGEVDFINNEQGDLENDQLVSFLSLNYLLTPSLNAKLSYEYHDPDDDIDEDEKTRISLIGEKFFNQYVQLRFGGRIFDGIPQNPIENRDILFTELHVFF